MRRLFLVFCSALFLVSSLACSGGFLSSGPPKPKHARSDFLAVDWPPAEFKDMDLPYYGGIVEESGSGYMMGV